MPSKLQAYAQMAKHTAAQITGSRNSWTAFLTTAARLYKYSYPEQLMIYAQRPDATACAEIGLWNEKMRRWVKQGGKRDGGRRTGRGHGYSRKKAVGYEW